MILSTWAALAGAAALAVGAASARPRNAGANASPPNKRRRLRRERFFVIVVLDRGATPRGWSRLTPRDAALRRQARGAHGRAQLLHFGSGEDPLRRFGHAA